MAPDAPLPSPPFIDIPGLRNFRDCGGYPIAGRPGKTFRRGVVFRSSEPSMLTDEGVSILQGLGITHVYDLRSQTEIDRDAGGEGGRQVREWDGARRIFVPVFAREDYSPEAIALRYAQFSSPGGEGFVQVYANILRGGASATGSKPWPTILAHLASTTNPDSPPPPLLVHCTAGKDRTGVICALVLSLCGVEDEAVAHEYSLTDLGLKERKEEFIAALVRQPPLKLDRAGAERMVSSRKENMIRTLAMIRENHGSVEKFVIDYCGLTPADIEQIRRNLIVDDEMPLDWQTHAKLTQ